MKKTIVAFIVVCICFVCVGCGDESDSTNNLFYDAESIQSMEEVKDSIKDLFYGAEFGQSMEEVKYSVYLGEPYEEFDMRLWYNTTIRIQNRDVPIELKYVFDDNDKLQYLEFEFPKAEQAIVDYFNEHMNEEGLYISNGLHAGSISNDKYIIEGTHNYIYIRDINAK